MLQATFFIGQNDLFIAHREQPLLLPSVVFPDLLYWLYMNCENRLRPLSSLQTHFSLLLFLPVPIAFLLVV